MLHVRRVHLLHARRVRRLKGSQLTDPSKPNHYFHDALGDPGTCKGDHNHPERHRLLSRGDIVALAVFALVVLGPIIFAFANR